MTANNASNSHQMLQELFSDIDDFADGYCDLALKDDRSFYGLDLKEHLHLYIMI